jgi:PAS domain S-box-containing protein
MTRRNLAEMSKEELIRELEKLETAERRFAAKAGDADRERLIHDLHVHQVQLEMQNRELREAQERLEEATSRYSDLYDFAPVGYCTLDPEGRIRELNLTATALFGAFRETLVGSPFPSVAPLKDKRQFHAHMRRCLRENGRVTSELTFSTGKRGTRTVQIISDPVRDQGGATTAYRTILVDISDLKAMENRLQLLSMAGETLASSLEATAVIESAARIAVPALADLCMIDVASESGTVERKFVLFADPKKQEKLAERLAQFTPRAGWQTPQARVIASGEPLFLAEVSEGQRERISYDDRHADTLRAADIRSLMVVPLNARGRTFGTLTFAFAESDRRYSSFDLQVAQDLSSRIAMALDNARLFHAAERAIQARDDVLGIVAHDLRNPLGNILMQAQLLRQRGTEPERRSRKPADAIERAANRMTRLIQDLLDITRIEAGQLSIEQAPVQAARAVSEFVEAQKPLASSTFLELRLDLAQDLGEIFADRDRLLQVLENLVGNAVKFTRPGGRVTVGAAPRDDEVLFWVADTGPGIEAGDKPHLFDRFWQARKVGRQGTGLGLPIVRGIIEAHGGRIWVESQVGVGSTFFFTLPLARSEPKMAGAPSLTSAENHVTAREQSTAESRQLAGIVLVVDDDADVRAALCETLARVGYQVATAANGAEALEYLHREAPPFLIIVDLVMPVMDGWAFLSERNRDPDLRSIPVIVVSGQRDVEDRIAAAHASYVPKPILANRLIETVEHVVH